MSSREWDTKPFDMNQFIPRTLVGGRASGTIIGGNADTFCHLLGTPFVPNMAGTILFIEDVHKDGSMLSREFLHMKLAGVFDQVAGIVIGEFVDVPMNEDKNHPSPPIEDVLYEKFHDLGVPVVYGYSFSHGATTIPVPIGAMCDMDADTGEISFRFQMSR